MLRNKEEIIGKKDLKNLEECKRRRGKERRTYEKIYVQDKE